MNETTRSILTAYVELYKMAPKQKATGKLYAVCKSCGSKEVVEKREARKCPQCKVALRFIKEGSQYYKAPKGMSVSYLGVKNGEGEKLSIPCQSHQVAIAKKTTPLLAAINSNSLGLTLQRLEKSYKAFFSTGGVPKFKSRDDFVSIAYQIGNGSKLLGDLSRVRLQEIGEIKVRFHRSLPQDCIPKQLVIRRESTGKWHVCIQAEVTLQPKLNHGGPSVGIDLGVRELFVLSDGFAIQALRGLENSQRELRILQRTLARRAPKPGLAASKNYLDTKTAIAKMHERIANARRDWNHKLSRALVEAYGELFVEKLDIAKMLREHEGQAHVRAYKNRAATDAAWGQFTLFLKYKAEETGCKIVEVDPAYTTRKCSTCGHDNPQCVKSKIFKCSSCGFSENRKKHSAGNVKAKGEVA